MADWMKAQPSIVSDTELSWNVVTTGPYMEMLNFVRLFCPFVVALTSYFPSGYVRPYDPPY